MITALLALIVAQTPSAPVRQENNPLAYMQSCMPGPLYGIQFSAANRAKVLLNVDGSRARLNFGTQWKVSCDANGAVMVCLHQTLNATISLGLGNDGGDGAGYTSADSANSAVGQARCLQLTPQTPTDFLKVTPASFQCKGAVSGRDPLTRCGACSSAASGTAREGDPCRVDADCGGTANSCQNGTSASAPRSTPAGTFVSFVPVSASSVCWMSRCDQ